MEMPKVKDFNVTKEDGTVVFNEEEYNKAMQSYLDNERRVASETAKKKGVEEGKKLAKDEANLTAEQKLEQDRKSFQEEMRTMKVSFYKEKVKSMYKEKGFDDKTIETLLNLVSDDENSSIATAKALCDSRTSFEESYKKKYQEDLQKNQSNLPGSGGKPDNSDISFAKQMALEVNKRYDSTPNQNNNN